jgi:transposase-like protein
MTNKMARRSYTEPFRAAAVREVIDAGRPVSDVARSLEIPKKTLAAWVRRARRSEPQLADLSSCQSDEPHLESSGPREHVALETPHGNDIEEQPDTSDAAVEPTTTTALNVASPMLDQAPPSIHDPARKVPAWALATATASQASKARGYRSRSSRQRLALLAMAYAAIVLGVFAITELCLQIFEGTSLSRIVLESTGLTRQAAPIAEVLRRVPDVKPMHEAPSPRVATGELARGDSAVVAENVPPAGRALPAEEAKPQSPVAASAPLDPAPTWGERAKGDKRKARAGRHYAGSSERVTPGEHAVQQLPQTASDAAPAASNRAARHPPPETGWVGELRKDFNECEQHGFWSRIVCTERARWKHCAPDRWGTARECPKVHNQ